MEESLDQYVNWCALSATKEKTTRREEIKRTETLKINSVQGLWDHGGKQRSNLCSEQVRKYNTTQRQVISLGEKVGTVRLSKEFLCNFTMSDLFME